MFLALLLASVGFGWLFSRTWDAYQIRSVITRADALIGGSDLDLISTSMWLVTSIRAGRYRQVLAMAKNVAELKAETLLRLDTLSGIASEFAEVGRLEEASQVVSEALPLVQELDNEGLRTSHLEWFARTLALAGKTKDALALVKRINDLGSRVITLSFICWNLSRTGRTQQASEPAEEALEATRQISKPALRAAGLGYAAWALRIAGRGADAVHTAENALAIARRLKQSEHPYAMSDLSVTLARAGMLEEGLHLARSLRNPRALENIVGALLMDGKPEAALPVAREIYRRYSLPSSLIKVARAFVRSGNLAEGGVVAEEALTPARQIRESKARSLALTNLAEVLQKPMKLRKAR